MRMCFSGMRTSHFSVLEFDALLRRRCWLVLAEFLRRCYLKHDLPGARRQNNSLAFRSHVQRH